jgi:hypothetical protein
LRADGWRARHVSAGAHPECSEAEEQPGPRFSVSKKLHLLLSYVSEAPTLEDRAGVAWTSDNEFKMNKSILADVMGSG